MKATIKLAGGSRLVEVEGETQKDVFERMADAAEVFGEEKCGLCGSTNIRPVHRIADKYHFYEFQCNECFAKLTFGQSQENPGALFPKRKLLPNGKPDLKEGSYGEHNGWTTYRGDKQGDDEPQRGVPSKSNQQNWPAQQSSLPPAPAFTNLRNMLGDMGVTDNEARFQDAVIQFVTKEAGKKIGYPQCAKSSEDAQWAISALEVGKIKHGDSLIAKVQEWMGAKR